MDQSSEAMTGSEVGCVTGPGVSGWLLETGSEVGLEVVGTSVGGSVRESVVVPREVTVSVVSNGAKVVLRVSGCWVVTAEVAGGVVGMGTVAGLGVANGVTGGMVESVAMVEETKGGAAVLGVAEGCHGLKAI